MPNDNETRTIERLEDEIRRLRLENIELRDNVQELKSRLKDPDRRSAVLSISQKAQKAGDPHNS